MCQCHALPVAGCCLLGGCNRQQCCCVDASMLCRCPRSPQPAVLWPCIASSSAQRHHAWRLPCRGNALQHQHSAWPGCCFTIFVLMTYTRRGAEARHSCSARCAACSAVRAGAVIKQPVGRLVLCFARRPCFHAERQHNATAHHGCHRHVACTTAPAGSVVTKPAGHIKRPSSSGTGSG